MELKFNYNKIMVLFVLFFPVLHIHLFFVAVNFLLLVLILINNKFKVNLHVFTIVSCLFIYLLIGSLLRFVYYEYVDFRDFFEIIRFFPVFLILLFRNYFDKISFKWFVKIIKIYVVIDFLVSICQYNKWFQSLIKSVTSFYASSMHYTNSLGLANRALGLSSSPGEHGVFILFLTTVLIINYLFFSTKDRSSIFIILIGTTSILVSQSQTAFIGMLLVNFLIFILFSIKGSNRKRFNFYFCFLTIASLSFVFYFLEQLRYLFTLFERGLGRTSYVKREEKFSFLIEEAFLEMQNVFLGWGKTYFGSSSGAMDNEHLYVFLVYGPLFYLILIVLAARFILLNFTSNYFFNRLFTVFIVLGLVMAWPGSFFFMPKILILLTLFYVNYYNKSKEILHQF